MANKLILFIVDDNIYKSEEYVEESIYDNRIEATVLEDLGKSFEWKGQHNLQELTVEILSSVPSINGDITTFGFTHPAICLDEIEKNIKPDIIIFDWEYGSESNRDSANWLKEILNSTDAFVFVYSLVRDDIPPFLNKQEFDQYAHRFQLFLKGDSENSIFSTEEFILQYILSRVSSENNIKVNGINVSFHSNGYLKDPTDILFLEKILGRTYLVKQLQDNETSITNESIENIIESAKGELLFDGTRNYLITPDSTLLIDKFKPKQKLSYLEVLKKYGLMKLKDVLETGITKV